MLNMFGRSIVIGSTFVVLMCCSNVAYGQCKNNPLNGTKFDPDGDDAKQVRSPTAVANGGCGYDSSLNGSNSRPGNGGDATARAVDGAGNNRATAKGGLGGSATIGKGGNGGSARARAASTGGNAIATADGGSGGNGGKGGRFGSGGNGGDASARATGGGGTIRATATAHGGGGGSAGPKGIDGGDGGDAVAIARNALISQATAVGGSGGTGEAHGTGGSAQANANATLFALARATGGHSTNGADKGAPAKATANASGALLPSAAIALAKGGGANQANGAKDGNATANSTASSDTAAFALANSIAGPAERRAIQPNGTANSTANATSKGLAIALSSAFGANGQATAGAITRPIRNGIATAVSVAANAPVNNAAAVGDARSNVGTAFNRALMTGQQSAVYATALPQVSDVAAATVNTPRVTAGLNLFSPSTTVLGLVDMGGAYSSGTAGASLTYTNSAEFEMSLSNLSGELKVGLLDPLYTGSGFDSLTFDIVESGAANQQFDYTFTSPNAAVMFFQDDVLELGPLSGFNSGALDLTFDFALTASASGQSFNTDLLFAVVGSPAIAAPEPASLTFVAFGLALIVLSRFRYRATVPNIRDRSTAPSKSSTFEYPRAGDRLKSRAQW